MVTNFDEPFHVNARVGGELLRLFITPVYNKINTEASFEVLFDGKKLGNLKRHNIINWEWEEGDLDQHTADEIGLKIDTHFN